VEHVGTEGVAKPPARPNRWKTIGIPFGVALLLWAAAWVVSGNRVAWEIMIAGVASLVIVGPTIVFGAAVIPGLTLSTTHLAVIVSCTTVLAAFVYAYNLDLVERLPKAGDWLRRARIGAQQTIRQRPWIRRLATLGVAIFVLLPLPGSGVLGGCLVARVIGLSSLRAFLATVTAGIGVAWIYASVGRPLERWLDEEQIGLGFRLSAVVALILIVILLVRLTRRFAARVPPARPPGDPGAAAGGEMTAR
jgi:uncharacterized membrane protein